MSSPSDHPLLEEAEKVLKTHGIGALSPPVPAQVELWEEFKGRPETQQVGAMVENRFYSGFDHSVIDWAKPVHAFFLDFKGDGMQLGMLLDRLSTCGEQYVFIGNPLPFNGGWHFTAVNDFEHPREQKKLDPSWTNRRIWHRVNYVATETEDGAVAIKSRDGDATMPITETTKFATIFLIGGLMPHTLNATMSPAACALLRKHLDIGTKFASIGHGLDVLLALGSPESCCIKGFKAAVFPNQEHLLQISGVEKAPDNATVFTYTPSEGTLQGSTLISTSYWGTDTVGPFFTAVGFATPGPNPHEPLRLNVTETILSLDFSKVPGISGASFVGAPGLPKVAVFIDNVADPIEAYNIISHLMSIKMSFTMISHSGRDECGDGGIRVVSTETVFGNAMYGLKDCLCLIPTCPADSVPSDASFTGFFVAGGQCPYFMIKDAAITSIIDKAEFGAAVCHGPELLIGSKWLHAAEGPKGPFISYYGCWMSFRDVIGSYEKKKPGEICEDTTSRLFTGNAPNSTKEMVKRACTAMTEACL